MDANDRIDHLYRDHARMLTAFARAKGAGPDEAEEVVQDAFVRLNRYGSTEKIENDLAFLRTIIVNLIRDRFRRRKIAPVFVDYDDVGTELTGEEPGPDRRMEARQALARALSDLDALPELTKTVFLRYRLKGDTYQKIADECGLTIALVRRHLRDALAALAESRHRDRPEIRPSNKFNNKFGREK